MPELPEVETIARGLEDELSGCTVAKASLGNTTLYRCGSKRVETLAGQKIETVERFGKAILFKFKSRGRNGLAALVVHLGMTGNLIVTRDGRGEPEPAKHLHARFEFEGGKELLYIDPRRFGFFYLGDSAGLAETLNIGPDPFQLKPATLAASLRDRKAPVKSLLLNQRLISGLGNIYADEALFRAGVHPLTPGGRLEKRAGELLRHIRAVLKLAIRHGGTTFRDYRRHDGSRGAFQIRLMVYGRTGESCRRCRGTIKRIVLGGRSTHFCPVCQKEKRARRVTGRARV